MCVATSDHCCLATQIHSIALLSRWFKSSFFSSFQQFISKIAKKKFGLCMSVDQKHNDKSALVNFRLCVLMQSKPSCHFGSISTRTAHDHNKSTHTTHINSPFFRVHSYLTVIICDMHLFIYLLAEPSSDHAALATHEIQLAKIMFISLAQYVCCFFALPAIARLCSHISSSSWAGKLYFHSNAHVPRFSPLSRSRRLGGMRTNKCQ